MMPSASFTFHGSLTYFLPRGQAPTQEVTLDRTGSIKDMLEALGPPHPEVEHLIVNGARVAWSYAVQDQDEVHAYPAGEGATLPAGEPLIPPYPGRPRFILDTHLGKLAGYLRMMGFDTLYRNDYEDDVLARVSHDEERILLTRDIGVLKRGAVVYGYFVRSVDPQERLVELCQRYALAPLIEPFARCMKCNGPVRLVEDPSQLSALPARVRQSYDEFKRCEVCAQVYWRGSHYQRLSELLELARGADAGDAAQRPEAR